MRESILTQIKLTVITLSKNDVFVGTVKQPVILRPLITLTGQKVVSLLLAGSHGWMDGWMDDNRSPSPQPVANLINILRS